MNVSLWRTRGEHRPLIGEFAYQVKFQDRALMREKAMHRAEDFFLLAAGRGEGLDHAECDQDLDRVPPERQPTERARVMVGTAAQDTPKAKSGPSFPQRGASAWRFTLRVFIGSAIVWYTLRRLDDTNPIWAVASMLASADPQVDVAARMFRHRIVNVLVGCAVGLVFLSVGGSSEWRLPLALAVTVLASAYLVRIPTMWRQAPITAAIVIAGGLMHQSKMAGLEYGLHKVGEAIFGCLVGLVLSWLMSRVWPLPGSENVEG